MRLGIFCFVLLFFSISCGDSDSASLPDKPLEEVPADGDTSTDDDDDNSGLDGDLTDGDDIDGDSDGDDTDGDNPTDDDDDNPTDDDDDDNPTDDDDDNPTDDDDDDNPTDDDDDDDLPCPDYDGQPDIPDENFTDNDCDGIDGTLEGPYFVDPENGVDWRGEATATVPAKTIDYALSLIGAEDLPAQLYLAGGMYTQPVTVKNGVSIYGGFDANDGWVRKAETPTIIMISQPDDEGQLRGILADAVTEETDVAFLTVSVSPNHTVPGGSSYGAWIRNSDNLSFHHITFAVGAGGAGMPGVEGAAGAGGETGDPGQNGKKDGSDDSTDGGAGAVASCGDDNTRGGNGGRGGYGDDNDPSPRAGADSPAGTDGGAGSATAHNDGAPGVSGEPGTAGQDGAGAYQDSIVNENGLFVAPSGTNGTNGTNGVGGGGGGGGGGSNDGEIGFEEYWGGAGGGGGGGGCLGAAALGGGGGGGSFGLFWVNSVPRVFNCSITVSNGGKGGDGGAGGLGGAGGIGGQGGTIIQNGSNHATGAGGKGGDGGKGGNGGDGGGGAGGDSVGLYLYHPQAEGLLENNNIITGSAGPGGTAPQDQQSYNGREGASHDLFTVEEPVVEADGDEELEDEVDLDGDEG